MKYLLYTALIFCQAGFSQSNTQDNFFANKWNLSYAYPDSLVGLEAHAQCTYFLFFRKVKFNKKENEYTGNIYFDRIKCIDQSNKIYSFIARFEINFKNDSSLFVKKVDHLGFNNTYQKDSAFRRYIYFFMSEKLKIAKRGNVVFLTNSKGEKLRLTESNY